MKRFRGRRQETGAAKTRLELKSTLYGRFFSRSISLKGWMGFGISSKPCFSPSSSICEMPACPEKSRILAARQEVGYRYLLTNMLPSTTKRSGCSTALRMPMRRGERMRAMRAYMANCHSVNYCCLPEPE